MVILASFQKHPYIAFVAALTLVIGAAYTLWLVKRVLYGEVANAHVAELTDVNWREALVLGTFALGTLAIGVYPKPLTDLMETSLSQLALQLANSKLL
jgi:NADH-quinone oxidoreductase subunit M